MKPFSVLACLVGFGLVVAPGRSLGKALVEARKIADIPWPASADGPGAWPSGLRQRVDERDAWSVVHTNAAPIRLPILAVENPAVLWLGFVVALYALRWQEAQSCGVPAKRLFTWHWAHCTVECFPVRVNFECVKVAPFHCVVV